MGLVIRTVLMECILYSKTYTLYKFYNHRGTKCVNYDYRTLFCTIARTFGILTTLSYIYDFYIYKNHI